jgi:hypothetical protein
LQTTPYTSTGRKQVWRVKPDEGGGRGGGFTW